MKQELLSMDFGKNTVTYWGTTLPTGTVGCEALNVSEEIIAAMEAASKSLDPALQAIQNRNLAVEMLFPAKASVLKCVDLLEEAFPSMKGRIGDFQEMVGRLFTKEAMANAIAYIRAVKKDGIIAVSNPQYKSGIGLLKLIPLMIQLPAALRVYQQRMIPFVEALQEGDRTAEGYSISHAAYFPEDLSLDANTPGWEQMMNVTVQYVAVNVPEKDTKQLVLRMNYSSFVGMFRADLYEGLRVGHAPKKCPICGRWFLTLDARHTKYCGNYAPGSRYTCRQIAAQQGREKKELAADHPINAVYQGGEHRRRYPHQCSGNGRTGNRQDRRRQQHLRHRFPGSG